MYGNRFHQSRQDEPNFFAVDTDSDHHTLVSRGLPIYESHQGSGPQHQTKSLIRSQVSDSPVGFDLFGDQQPMNHPQSSMVQSMKQQQSGFSDMQQLQQQLMLRKMQELQRQQQLRQLDARQQSAVNPLFPFAKQGMGNYPSPLINGAASSDSLNKHWGTELGNMNWLQRASPAMQGSSDGLVFSSNHGQGQHLMGLVPQQGDQSLYGVPVCGSRGHVTQFSQLAGERPSMQQMATFGNCLPGNQYTVFPEQANIQDGSLISRQKFSGENHFGHSSGQALSPLMNMENLQQVNPMQRNASPLETQGRQELSALQEKSSTQFATSQNEVALDPTEERILFGSDDNIWAAFGTSSNMSGDSCGPFDTGGPNGFPSLQGGTWSALMQSAVAETSGSNIGLQEEWSSLNFQNTIVPPGNQHPTTYSEKQQTSFSNDLMPSSLNSSVFPSNNSSMNNDNQNVLGFQQLGNKFAFEPGNSLQANFSQKPVKSSEVGSKWSNAGPLQNAVAEASPIYRKASLSLDAETNIKSPSGPWTPVQTGLGQQYGNPNGGNILPSVARSGDASVSMHESENSSQHSQGSEQKRIMHGKVVHGGSLWNSSSIPSSTVEAEHAKSSGGSLQVNRDGFSVSSAAVMPNSSTAGVNELPSQYPSNSYQLNYWQNVNSAVKSQGGESVPMSHDHVNKDNQDMESSLNSCDQEEVQTTEMETCSKKENSSDNYRSNLCLHNSAGGSKETVWTHVSDSQSLPSGNQKSVNQIGQKNCGARKFQFHPLGNLDEDVEPSYGMKQPSHLLAMSQQRRHFGQFPESSAGLAKGQSADQKDAKGIDDTTTCGTLPGHIQNTSIPFDRSLCMYTPSKDSQSSQNMLELLHKVDQSREHGSVMHFSSSECNLSSEMPEAENSDGSVGRLQQSHSSSQGFGLQLGPPSHRMAVPNQSFSSQSSLQTVNSLHQSQGNPEIREKGQSQFSATSSVQSLLPSEKPLGELKNNRSGLPGQASGNAVMHKIPGAFNSGFPYSRSELHYPQIVRASEQVSTNQNYNSGSFGGTSQQSNTNHPNARSPAEQVSYGEPVAVSRSLSASGIPQQGSSASAKLLPNMWSNFPGQSHLMGAQFNKVSAHVPQLHQQKVLESTSYAAYKQGNQDARTGHDSPSEFAVSSMNKESSGHQLSTRNINPVHKLSEPQGSGPVPKNLSDVSPANSASMQKDLEAFGRSLKSNNILHQNFSLLNQMRAIKTAESDPNDRVSKRMKGAESSVEGQQVAPKTAELSENNIDVGNALTHNSAVSSGDSKMLSSSGPVDNAERKASSERGNIALQNLHEFSQDDSQSNHHGNNPASVRVEHSQISPQMAPSWFSQYGTFRNGQMLALYDAHKTTIKETMEQPFTLGKSSSGSPILHSMEQATAAHVDTGQVGSIQPSSTPTSAAHFALPQSLPLRVLRPKKRKRATSELIPWHKEVSLQSQNLQTISMAEVDWAKAANRLTERVKDEVEFIEDGPPMLRAKRRLTLTTQLMQQLLCPPRYAILSADADSNYKSVAYTISRLALGDVCGLVSCSSSDSDMPDDVVNQHSDKCKKSERVDDQHLLKVMEDFMGRARKLENNLLRLDKRASVLDLRLECQELEKFSVINRFAKFHGRGQAESSGASSSSDAAANALKPFPQRYVTALPIPRNLPDGVQCLSL